MIAAQLVRNGIRFRYLRRRGKGVAPWALSMEITHRCVARCVMCNIWKIPADVPDPPMSQWIGLLSDPLFSELVELDITGGEPFLRADLADLFFAVCDLKPRRLGHLKSIAVTTNGLLTERVLETTRQILPALAECGVDLVLACAMDGVGERHDRIRNHPNAWRKVDATIAGLIELRDRFPNLILGIKTTLLPINLDEMAPLRHYAETRNLFTIMSPCIVTPGRYLNPEKAESLAFTDQDKGRMAAFFRKHPMGWDFHAERLIDYFRTGKMKKPCTCGFNYAFIRSTGELFLCPLIAHSAGNIRASPVGRLWHSATAARIRRCIGRFPECDRCTEPGLERYSLPFEGFSYLFMRLKMGKTRFQTLHRHMGLNKYFT